MIFEFFSICMFLFALCMFFSFWLISLCVTDSRSIHITTNDAVSLLFYNWVIFRCIYVQHLLYPFISLWARLSMNFNLHFYTSEKENLFNIWIESVFSFLWTLSSDPLPMPIFLFICWIFSFSFFKFTSCGKQDPNSLTRDWKSAPCIGSTES